MTKKIDSALHDLVKALEKHADVVQDKKAPKSKVQRAKAKVRATASHYAAVVYAKTGAESPFADVVDPRLDAPTVASLKAERDKLAKKLAEAEAERFTRRREATDTVVEKLDEQSA
ncbi:hypothetical protein HQQ80_06680 [Microbacteriaceae bacterium VKM Ac-2855]|nr:hypothetical protein [Microbacteriaceae bacterium VKM Ac-2855]